VSHDILFQLEFFFLVASAQIAATLTGFIGVVFVVGERAQGRLSTHESSAVFHFMFAGMGTLLLSLLAAVLLVCLSAHENLAWRVANGLIGLFHMTGAGRLAVETWRNESGVRRASITSGIGLAVGSACLLSAAGFLPQLENLILMLATLWSLCVTVISFISLLLSPRDAT
jgi:hypothetical protein